MTKLLITGSRECDQVMIEYTIKLVTRADTLDWEIIVGDAPGVDKIVIRAADLLGVTIEVVGAYKKIRNATRFGLNTSLDMSYPERDVYMAERCDWCVAVWNGQSRGTMITYNAARKLGKKVHIKSFK